MMKKSTKSIIFAIFMTVVGISLQACTFSLAAPTETPTASPIPPTETPVPPTATATATSTFTLTPTNTMTPSLTPTYTLTYTPTPTITNTPLPLDYTPEGAIIIYLILPDTGGPVGCGDTLVPYIIGRQSGDLEADITTALNALFSAGQYFGGLYNATYSSSLKVSGVQYNKNNHEVGIDLSGQYVPPENRCEAHRYRAQVWRTAEQFEEVNHAVPRANGPLLGDRLYAVMTGDK